jgi:SAM-dependent methyltransferase
MQTATPHKKYLNVAAATIGFRGQNVLEVGGCSPPALVRGHGPLAWTAVNLNSQEVDDFNEQARELSLTGYSARYQDIALAELTSTYDRIYSINSFEHVKNLTGAFEKMCQALRPGGLLFTLFGPIWSSDVGHHLSLSTDQGPIHFGDGVLEPWEHLTSTPAAIGAKLQAKYGKSAADRAVEFIFTYPDLNRVFEHEYLEVVAKSGLSPVMIVRNKKGQPPKVAGATSTRELVLVLKKGRPGLLERGLAPLKFGGAYLWNRSL